MFDIDLSQWVPAWISIGSVAAIGYFFRDRIAKFIDAKLQHQYDAQLERLRDELSRNAEEVEALRSSVLSLRGQRQAGIEKRRLDAIDQLWAAVKALQSRKGAAISMSIVKFEPSAERAKTDAKVRELFEMIGGGKVTEQAIPLHQAHEAQPYVSPLAWALFSAYQSAITYPYLQLAILQTGVGADKIKDPKDLIGVLSEALPEWEAYLEKHGTGGFPYAIDELEKRLLAELRRMLAGEDDDTEQVAKAARIVSKVNEVVRNEREAEARAALAAEGQEIRVADTNATPLG